ncbi:hypothetical protein [Mycoplasmopsis alligatoris]|uniref:Uncharacterized protein n=1 Tax=Mycoplasmopsis alligatoris A21JP2 TaxID=747682 RepID=D4XVR7_9BACT|nr:hypothetical protein [Mycoplasmopsis alligatoris]EFF41561.1 hypothetical protein MALL_0205 [Mycoplasmopsis alligatoris A21JP2]
MLLYVLVEKVWLSISLLKVLINIVLNPLFLIRASIAKLTSEISKYFLFVSVFIDAVNFSIICFIFSFSETLLIKAAKTSLIASLLFFKILDFKTSWTILSEFLLNSSVNFVCNLVEKFCKTLRLFSFLLKTSSRVLIKASYKPVFFSNFETLLAISKLNASMWLPCKLNCFLNIPI